MVVQRLRFLALPNIPRMISRPSVAAAATANDFTAGVIAAPASDATVGSGLGTRAGAGARAAVGAGVGAAGAAGAGASRAASRSYAESRSIAVPYLTCSGEAATAAVIMAGSEGPMNDCGARSRVHATGVGAPFSTAR